MDKHELVARLKEVALELGRTPTRMEFETRVRGGKYGMEKEFGGFVPLLHAAGLEPRAEQKRKKPTSEELFGKALSPHLLEHKAPPLLSVGLQPTFAVVSDIHWPFPYAPVLEAFLGYVERKKPDYVLLNGDAHDMYSNAKFPRTHNLFTPREEEALARRMNEEFWREVQKRSPRSKCVQLLGNHDVRPLKRQVEQLPSMEHWIQRYFEDLFTFEGVQTIFDVRQELIVGDALVFHGHRSRLGAHRDFTLWNCVNGHTHKGGVVFRNVSGLSAVALGLTYTAQKYVDWTHGFGARDEDGPRFIPV
jgi:predicted phosphodiesterase